MRHRIWSDLLGTPGKRVYATILLVATLYVVGHVVLDMVQHQPTTILTTLLLLRPHHHLPKRLIQYTMINEIANILCAG